MKKAKRRKPDERQGSLLLHFSVSSFLFPQLGAAPDAMGLRGNSPYPLTMEQNLPSLTYILSQRGEKQLDTKLLLKRGEAAVANTVHWLVGFVPNSVQLWVRGPRTVGS